MNLRLSGPDTENNKRLCWSRDLTENLQNPHGTEPNRTPRTLTELPPPPGTLRHKPSPETPFCFPLNRLPSTPLTNLPTPPLRPHEPRVLAMLVVVGGGRGRCAAASSSGRGRRRCLPGVSGRPAPLHRLLRPPGVRLRQHLR